MEMKFSPGVHTEQFTGILQSLMVRGYTSQKDKKPYKKLFVAFENDDLSPLSLMINITQDGTVNESSDGGRYLKSLQTQGFNLDIEITNPSEDMKPEDDTKTMYEAIVTVTMNGRKDVPIVSTPYPKGDYLKWECTGTGTVDTPTQATLGLSNMIRLNAETILPLLPNPFSMSDFVMAVNAKFDEGAPEINNVKDAVMMEFVQRGKLVRDGDKFRKVGA